MKKFGLIGKTLSHSFSKKYFEEKFTKENIKDCSYNLFELPDISVFPELIKEHHPDLVGLNVTIPYKLDVMGFLSEIDENAQAINAVNTIKILHDGTLKGYNTDYFGFKNSLLDGWDVKGKKALILGTGGASNAVKKTLHDLEVPFLIVSRKRNGEVIDYQTLHHHPELIKEHELIINCTPLGTYPKVDDKPDIPYQVISKNHLLFDLVYNPETTSFMRHGLQADAKAKNGYDMLVGQAEAAWQIWNE